MPMLIRDLGQIRPGIYRRAIDLLQLYPDPLRRDAFERRWEAFAHSGPEHEEIFARDGNFLVYPTESFLSPAPDPRPAVLLLLGNPASQSVRAGMCFAFEHGKRTEHRFWRSLRCAGWLDFGDEDDLGDCETRNSRRRGLLLSGEYRSPFRIGIDVLHTFPSPASAPKWSGVAGLQALFGRGALGAIATSERDRLRSLIHSFTGGSEGAVVAFQKDAYETLRDPKSPAYSATGARQGIIVSGTAAGASIPLFAAPPTRLAHTDAFGSVLRRYRDSIMQASS